MEIQGFKSFSDKTKLEFHQPITAVVGPNGSGKSNIGDAIRWVLGEQSTKTLRGAKMEDVIFGGTQKRKPMGFASVCLNIDNEDRSIDVDSDEVSISRKIYRSGESEYKINGNSVRLKDIYQMFLDTGLGKTGYSIIGQGKIAEIISAKNTERREIFEEAAGIAKHKYHKEEAQKKLSQTEENLDRLLDIMNEIEGRIEPLKKDSEKAAEFVQYSGEKKILEISIWIKAINEAKALINKQNDLTLITRSDYEKVNGKIEESEKSIQRFFSEMQNCSVKIENNRNEIKKFETELTELNSQNAVYKNDIEHNNKTAEDLKEELKLLNSDKENTEKAILAIRNEIEKNNDKLIDAKKAIEKLRKKSDEDLSAKKFILSEISAKKAHRTALYVKINEAKVNAATSSTMLSENRNRLEQINEQINNFTVNTEDRQKSLEEIEDALLIFDEKITEEENEKQGYEMKLRLREEKFNQLNKKLTDLTDQIKANSQRAKLLNDMEKSMEGFSYSVKSIHKAAETGRLNGILGTVSGVISTEEKYSLAIETALGAAMQNIIVRDEFAAKQAVSYLAREKAGRATFLPLTSIKPTFLDINKVEKEQGFVGLGKNLVKYDEKYQNIISSLLGRIVIAQDLDLATDIAKKYGYKFKIVTLDGQVINAGGSFTGGSHVQSAGLLSRRSEMNRLYSSNKEIEREKIKFEEELNKLNNEINEIKAHIKATESQINVAISDKQITVSEKNEILYAIKNETIQRLNYEKEKEKLEKLMVSWEENENSVKEFIMSLEADLKQTEEEIASLNLQNDEFAKTSLNNTEKINNAKTSLLLLERDIDALKEKRKNLAAQEIDREERNKQISEKIAITLKENEILNCKISENEIKALKIAEHIGEYESSIKILSDKRISYEKESTELRVSIKNIMSDRENISAEIVRLEEKLTGLQVEVDTIVAKLWDEYELTRSEAEKMAVEIGNNSEAEKRLLELRAAIKSLGNVNLGAIEEYREVNERYQFMKAQIDDVEKSRTALKKLIDDLTRSMKEIFARQFNLINENFKNIFYELFEGGKGNLYLTEPDNILESGIEIEVEPPGKIIRNLTALSGGEQAFVAISIYFAILKVNPSPFCILDEIEAALDDVNVTKYARYLRKLSDKTQFIAITHRRGTMEEADVLYGVTMQEEGVSKLLELKVAEIEQKLGNIN